MTQFDTAIPIGGSEAAEVVQRIQNAEAHADPSQSLDAPEVDDATANAALAQAWVWLMDLRASQGAEYEHWRADDAEEQAIRDHVAPSVKELIPNRLLAKSDHAMAVGTVAGILLKKRMQDPE